MRRVSIDAATAELIRRYRAECEGALAVLDRGLPSSSFIFSASVDHSRPRSPSAMTHRFKRLADRLGVDAHLHALRHYAATELLAAGVDLRTVAGRLGHGDGTTTLRHYAAWVDSADRRAAVFSALASRPPRPTRSLSLSSDQRRPRILELWWHSPTVPSARRRRAASCFEFHLMGRARAMPGRDGLPPIRRGAL